VTNAKLAEIVEEWGGKAMIVPDIPAGLPDPGPAPSVQRPCIVVVSSYSDDEPLEQLWSAAASFPEGQFYVTGNPRDAAAKLVSSRPDNVHITGFLSDADYVALLAAADVIVALTDREHTMQRGGCEALALEKPLVTSGTALLRSFFERGTVHVDGHAEAIREGVVRALDQKELLGQEMRELSKVHRSDWDRVRARLRDLVEGRSARD
jgi:glycosyltransferase involved in cell wall biosynthesis